ncbi:GTP-binding protein HflX [Gammaproteobacteria bacterium]|nr:GTP-binding protein HflX [Gammaproteobacteria bacterium]
MFEHNQKYQGGDKAILVAMEMPDTDPADSAEFLELVTSATVIPLQVITGKRQYVDKRYFVGTGKAEEIRLAAVAHDADVVIFNHALRPSQTRNLERLLEKRVIDRTGLILDIFAQRAQSFEGKLQVELAQLKHISTRLVRMWTHLERQKGGIGMRGPGETQLESDKRMIITRIGQIQKKLDKVEETRRQSRLARQKSATPTIAFVGYTNAGKSSLFNQLTHSDIYVADKLFATLDPTHRALELTQTGKAILIDTVGFISKLPHELIAAFKSTLQESVEADLLLEVIDSADPEREHKMHEVAKILNEIGASGVPKIQIFNKIDLLDEIQPHFIKNEINEINTVYLSAQDSTGIDLLLQAISERFQETHVRTQLTLPPYATKLRAQLFELDAITCEQISDTGEFILDIYTAKRHLLKLATQDAQSKTLLSSTLNDLHTKEIWE